MKTRNLVIIFIICLIAIVWGVAELNADPAADLARTAEINTWFYETIPYVGLTPLYIKTPADTLINGGDCADLSAAVILLLSTEGIEAEMQTMYLYKTGRYHAVVVVHGLLFDPTTGKNHGFVFPRPHEILRKIGKEKILADWAK